METNKNNELRKNLDELIRLFKKVKNTSRIEDIPGIDKNFFQNFELLLNNYDMIKDDLTDELLNQFGAPIHIMISETVETLKRELGEDALDIEEAQEVIEEPIDFSDEAINIEEEIQRIDEELTKPNLNQTKIDHLLDKRSALKGLKKN